MTGADLLVVLFRVVLVELSGFVVEWACTVSRVRTSVSVKQRWDLLVRFAEQTLQTQQHALDIVDSTPLILQNV